MILAVLGLLFGNAASLLWAYALTRRIGITVRHVEVLVILLIRLVLISALIVLAGLSGYLSATYLSVFGLVALGGFFLSSERRALVRFSIPSVNPFIAACLLLVGLRLFLQMWFFAPHVGDATNWYLPKVAEWVRAEGFTREMGANMFAYYPAGFELLETWWVVYLHHDVFIEMGGIEFLALAVVATYSLARSTGLSHGWASFAGLLYSLAPGPYFAATSCINDLPASALFLATAALVCSRSPLALTVMVVGIGLGVKPTYGYALPGLVVLWYLERGRERLQVKAPRIILGLAGVGLAVGAYWYVRNIVWFGNPIYPLGSPDVVLPFSPQVGPSLASLRDNLLSLADLRIYDRHIYGAMVDNGAGWGGVGFACGAVSLLIAARTNRDQRSIALAFGVSLLTVLTLSINDPWSLKYVFFFPAILYIAVAHVSRRARPVLYISIVALACQCVGTVFSYDLQRKDFSVLASQSWRTRTAAPLFFGSLPSSDVIGFLGYERGNPYLLYGPDFARKVVYLRPRSQAELMNQLREAHVPYVFSVPTKEQRAILQECVSQGLLVPMSGRIYKVVQGTPK